MGAQGRITLSEAARLVDAVVNDVTREEHLRLWREENAVIKLCVAAFAKPADLAYALKIPSRWIRTTDKFVITARGQHVQLRVRYPEGDVASAPLLPAFLFSSGGHNLDSHPELAERVNKLYDDRKAYKERREVLQVKTRAVVGSATTIKKLAEIWPEGEPYWRKLYAEWRAGRQLPVPDVSGLNKALGLPKEKQAA